MGNLSVKTEKTVRKNKMGVMPVGRLMFTMSVPLVISMFVQALYNVVDSFFVAQISTDALTAVSLAYPLQMLMIGVAVGTGIGLNSYISRQLGAGNIEDANRGGTNGLFVMLLSSAAFAVLGIFIKPFFRLFTEETVLIEYGSTYLRICMIGSLGMFIEMGCEKILQAIGKNALSMVVQLTGAIANIILDPLLIFGIGPFPELGIAGAAYATVIGQWLGMLISLILVLAVKHEIKLDFRHFRPDKKAVKEIYRVGFPSIMMQSIGFFMNTGLNAILARILVSDPGITVMGVYFKVQSMIFLPLFGITASSMSIFAYNYGAQNRLRFAKTWKLTLLVTILLMTFGTVMMQIFPRELISLFDPENEISEMGAKALRIISLHFPLAAVSVTCSVMFQAVGKASYSLITSIIRQLGVLLPAAFILALIFKDVDHMWWCFIISEFSAAVISLLWSAKIWKKEIRPMPDGEKV